MGLLLLFFEIDLPDEAMDKYLAGEDRLFYALKVFEGSEQPPQNEEVWRFNGQAWKILKGVYSLREAQEKCAAVMATQTAGWHVPSADDFVAAFVAMKSPTRNPIFGAEAATLGDVWTGQANPKSPGTYYFLNFQTTKWGFRASRFLPRALHRKRQLGNIHTSRNDSPRYAEAGACACARACRQDCLGRGLAWRM